MYGASREIAVLRLTQVLESFQAEVFVDGDGERFNATFSAGVAEFSTDGRTLDDLYRAAISALSEARAAGCAQVIPAGWIGEPQLVDHTVDVALVEDDAALASLLLHALETRGYHAEWYQDGEAAAHALAGPASRVQAQVVLLDVGLPGLDGFDVLRRLVDGGVTQRTRVIMLTAHAAENEVLAALELGAFDHVAKPFSTPVLLQRIRRAMRR
jgi:CheY-like chemotaxis protein